MFVLHLLAVHGHQKHFLSCVSGNYFTACVFRVYFTGACKPGLVWFYSMNFRTMVGRRQDIRLTSPTSP